MSCLIAQTDRPPGEGLCQAAQQGAWNSRPKGVCASTWRRSQHIAFVIKSVDRHLNNNNSGTTEYDFYYYW